LKVNLIRKLYVQHEVETQIRYCVINLCIIMSIAVVDKGPKHTWTNQQLLMLIIRNENHDTCCWKRMVTKTLRI
jgi:hypothetical protein